MNQGNYDQFNYDNYDASPKRGQPFLSKILSNPLLATGAILGCGLLLSGTIVVGNKVFSGPSEAPVILADASPYKVAPTQEARLEMPFEDSTIYDGMRDGNAVQMPPVENLLSQEMVVDRTALMAKNDVDQGITSQDVQSLEPAAGDVGSDDNASLLEQATGVKSIADAQGGDTLDAIKTRDQTEDLLKKLDQAAEEQAARNNAKDPSPETVEFVRNVLNAQNAEEKADASNNAPEVAAEAAAKEAAAVKPAAGFSTMAGAAAGTHYVQLGSVKSEAGAASEWTKLQKKYPTQLSDVNYRVQRADLGERGTFYRIQAGPISGEAATRACDEIKAKTPGGCLVVK